MPDPCHRTISRRLRRRLLHSSILPACLIALAAVCGSSRAFDFVRCPLADGFDFPVGKPNAAGYHKARGFWPNGHLGEDWDGNNGGDTDLGDPIYAIGRGVCVLSEDVKLGWGNCIIIRHAFRDSSGKIDMVDSLYGHLLERKLKVGQVVERGQLVGKMGSNNGMYAAHLHLEIRKNLALGMNRTKFARDYSNYYSPTSFIEAHRQLAGDYGRYQIPINTFAPHGQDLTAEQRAFALNRGSPAGTSSGGGTSSSSSTSLLGVGSSSASNPPSVKKTPGGLSIPITTTGANPSKSGGLPKVTESGKPGPSSPPEEPKADFWTRLKAKLRDGQVTDSEGRAPRNP